MAQSRRRSFAEAWINIAIGYSLNTVFNLIIFRSFGYPLSLKDGLYIGVIFTSISLTRQYIIRRWFAKND